MASSFPQYCGSHFIDNTNGISRLHLLLSKRPTNSFRHWLLISKIVLLFFCFLSLLSVQAQDNSTAIAFNAGNGFKKLSPAYLSKTDTSTINKSRLWLVAGGHAAFWVSTYVALDKTWYSQYPRSSFHFFNDNSEWEQMDKFGHAWTAYNLGRISGEMWQWTGLSRKKSVIYGGLSAIAYQSIIEIQDGFSSEWGFSWGDMTANAIGAGAYIAQELGWKDQRIQIKLSYWPYDYSSDLLTRRNQLFGTSLPERMLKDYNSQTYWISMNLKSFFPQSKLPAWLNLSLGYSADGMLGGTENTWTDKQGVYHDRTDIPRVRRFFIAPDIDLTKIKTKSKLLKTIFFAVNILKLPSPAIELNSKGKLVAHAFYY